MVTRKNKWYLAAFVGVCRASGSKGQNSLVLIPGWKKEKQKIAGQKMKVWGEAGILL